MAGETTTEKQKGPARAGFDKALVDELRTAAEQTVESKLAVILPAFLETPEFTAAVKSVVDELVEGIRRQLLDVTADWREEIAQALEQFGAKHETLAGAVDEVRSLASTAAGQPDVAAELEALEGRVRSMFRMVERAIGIPIVIDKPVPDPPTHETAEIAG